MPLLLFGHLFSSNTQKVLVARHENGTPFELRGLGRQAPANSAEWLRRWPLRQFPLMVDGERTVVETIILIEYLPLAHPGSQGQAMAVPNRGHRVSSIWLIACRNLAVTL